MGGRNCCVKNCRRRSHDHHGRKIPNGLTFHCFPAWRTNEGGQISELTRRRRAAWVAAVDRSSITFDRIPSSMRVCSRHFHSGKPAYEMLESDPDWAPSLNLGHSDGSLRRAERLPMSTQAKKKQKQKSTVKKRRVEASEAPQIKSEAAEDWVSSLHLDQHEENSRRAERPSLSVKSKKKQIKRKRTETRPAETSKASWTQSEAAEGLRKPSVPPWREVKSVLQSLLQSNTSKKPEDETLNLSADNITELSFRDFFRSALEASLEASIRSRAQSKTSPSELTVELNLRAPPPEGESDACEGSSSSSLPVSSSSSCLKCVRLQRRVEELKEKLSQVTGGHEEMEALKQPDQSPETTPEIEEEVPEWSELVSPDQELHQDNGEDEAGPSGRKRRPTPRFRKEWLSMFWFLRYSPIKDLMWCHVCRLHAAPSYQKLSLIKGSRVFKLDGIKKHRNTIYHKENMEQHMMRSRFHLASSS